MTSGQADEARADKVTATLAVLETEISRITSGEDWRRFLQLQSCLHAYSPNNVLLIAAQHADAFAEGRVSFPEPSMVAGFNTWKRLGRSVERGQRGYAILAPLRVTVQTATDRDGSRRVLGRGEKPGSDEQLEARPVLRGFRVEHVFDVTQTTGRPLAVPPTPTWVCPSVCVNGVA